MVNPKYPHSRFGMRNAHNQMNNREWGHILMVNPKSPYCARKCPQLSESRVEIHSQELIRKVLVKHM